MPKKHGFCPTCQEGKDLSNNGHDMRLGLELRIACDLSLFSLHYQPQFDLVTGSVVGAEALLRCHHAPFERVAINKLIQIAEHYGLIQNIGCWAFEESCRQLRAWMDSGYDPIRIAVNVSALQLDGVLFHETISLVLQKYNIPAELVEIEVTETQSIFSNLRCLDSLAALRHMGFRLALDDFGTGYSSLSYLKQLKAHKLKIDRSFVRHLPFGDDDRLIISSVIGLGRAMGIDVLAEGVETKEQAIYLMNNGCDTAQGFLFGRPVDAGTFENLYLSGSRTAFLSMPL